jgi:hypothetical protein
MKYFQMVIAVEVSISDAFRSINNVTKWWTENLEGSSQKLNDEFSVYFGDVHFSKQKLVELVPDKKVVWLVTDSNLNFISNKQEWTNTKISFELSTVGNKTQIRFTHIGLVSEMECYDACSSAWTDYIKGSLFELITTDRGNPSKKET